MQKFFPLLLWAACCFGGVSAVQQHRASAAELLRKAETHIRQENFTAAESLLLKAKVLSPADPAIRHQLGYALFRQRRLASAVAEFQAVLRLSPPAFYSRYFLGRIAVLERRFANAVKWLEPVLAAEPPVPDAAHQLGKAYLEIAQPHKAIEALQLAVAQTAWDASVHYSLARAYEKAGWKALATEEFGTSDRLRAADRELVEKLLYCSENLARGEREQALEIRGQILHSAHHVPDALVSLGVLLASAGLIAESLEPFRLAAEVNPNLFQAQYNHGLTLLKLGQAAGAEGPLLRAAGLEPASYDVNVGLALVHIGQKQYASAVPWLEKARSIRPQPRVLGMLATAYLRTSAPDKAVQALRQVVPKEHSDAKLHLLLIEALQASGQETAGIEAAQQALRLFPSSAPVQLALAQALVRAGKYQQASPHFRKASELDPGDARAVLGLGEALQKNGSHEEALAVYQRALQLDPASLDGQLGMARSLVAVARLSEARETLERALKSHPESAAVHFELARLYARLQQPDLASEHTRIFQQLRAKEADGASAAGPR